MTLFATLACVPAGAHLMAPPALLVNHDLGAERFVRDIDRIGQMARRTGVSGLLEFSRFVVTDRAIDPGRFEIVRMRRIQRLCIYLMVALDTFDRKIFCVHLMVKDHFTDRRGKYSFWRPRHAVRLGGYAGDNKEDCRYQRSKIFDHDCLVLDA